MKNNNCRRSIPASIRAYIAISIGSIIHLKAARLLIIAGLTGVGCIDYAPTILAITKIVLVFINTLTDIVKYLLTANDVAFEEIYTLTCNANNQFTAAVECYLQVISRD